MRLFHATEDPEAAVPVPTLNDNPASPSPPPPPAPRLCVRPLPLTDRAAHAEEAGRLEGQLRVVHGRLARVGVVGNSHRVHPGLKHTTRC